MTRKNRFSGFCISALFAAVLAGMMCISCGRRHSDIREIVVAHPFEHGNWTFEDEVIDFPFTVVDTAAYRIEFVLDYDSAVNVLQTLPVTVTLESPDGMSSFVGGAFRFDMPGDAYAAAGGKGTVRSMKMVAFPKKRLPVKGLYHIRFYRKAPKYDNYGLNCLTLHVVPLE